VSRCRSDLSAGYFRRRRSVVQAETSQSRAQTGIENPQTNPVGSDGVEAKQTLVADRRAFGEFLPAFTGRGFENERLDALPYLDVLAQINDIEGLRSAEIEVDRGGRDDRPVRWLRLRGSSQR
jgi:hypothetical protein